MTRKALYRLALSLLLAGAAGLACDAQLVSTAIAVTGMSTGLGGARYTTIATDMAVAGSYVAFKGNTDEKGFNDAIWLYDGSVVRQVAHDGMTVPGAPGTVFGPDSVNVGRSGTVAFVTMGLQGFSVVRGDSNGLSLVALGDNAAPGSGGKFVFFGLPSVDSAGNISMEASTDQVSTTGLWTKPAGGSLKLQAMTGQSAPGGTIFYSIANNVRASTSRVVCRPTVEAYAQHFDGLYSFDAAGSHLIAQPGDAVPGMAGATFTGINSFVMNDNGSVAFSAYVKPNLTSMSSSCLFLDTGTGPQPIVRYDQSYPVAGGVTFSTFSSYVINPRGDVGFLGRTTNALSTGRHNGLFCRRTDGSIRLVATEGQGVDDLPGQKYESFSTLAVNNAGQLCFVASLTSGAKGLFAQDATGHLRLVTYEGQTFEVVPGSFSTVKSFTLSDSYNNAVGSPFTSAGISYYVQFLDGRTGIYKADVVPLAMPGDANWDGLVNFSDYLVLEENFGHAGGLEQGDFNASGTVNFSDYLILEHNFNQSTAVPEPVTLATLAFSVTMVSLRRRAK